MIIENAMRLSSNAHRGQMRKGKNLPYIVHPIQVAALVAKHGGSQAQIAGALLHDVIEDCGRDWAINIELECGRDVLDIVLACSDCVPVDGQAKAPWRERKQAYIDGIKNKPADAMLVIACDKLANASEIAADLNDGQDVMSRFSADRDSVLWYYRSLSRELWARDDESISAICLDLERQIVAMEAMSL